MDSIIYSCCFFQSNYMAQETPSIFPHLIVSLHGTYYPGNYRKTSNISRTLVGNNIVDNSDVVGASPVGAAPTSFSFST